MNIPANYQAFLELSPQQVQQLVDDLAERPLTEDNIDRWLQDWSAVSALFQECMARYDVATAVNTADDAAKQRQQAFRETIWPIGHRMYMALNERMQQHADIMPESLRAAHQRQAATNALNQTQEAVDLLNEQMQLFNEYESIRGAQTVEWNGQTTPLRQLWPILQASDREQREQVWRAIHNRQLQDRDAISQIWSKLLDIRLKLAEINGFDDYLSYRWTELGRTDYTPQDSGVIHAAVLKHWSPLHTTVMQKQAVSLQLDTIRPWDEQAAGGKAIHPFNNADDLYQKTLTVFQRMDSEFGAYVEKLHNMGFIDLSDRMNTGSMGGFSRAIGRHGNFIFLNLENAHEDMVNIVHELGHAVSIHASCQLPYMMFWGFPADFSETPSTLMEMLTQPYWDAYYTPDELEQVRNRYFQQVLRSSLQETVFDAFQHWVYRNPTEARDPDACDAQWFDLNQRYRPGIDWSGLESLAGVGWQAMGLNFYMPLHALEYFYGRVTGLQLLKLPQSESIARYKAAIALGNSVTTKALFAALGVDFPITAGMVADAAHDLAGRL